IMGIVYNDFTMWELKDVHPARIQLGGQIKRTQSGLNGMIRETGECGCQYCRKCILNHALRMTFQRDRYVFHFYQPNFAETFRDGQPAIFNERCSPSPCTMCSYPPAKIVHTEQSNAAGKILSHGINELIIGIQDRIPVLKCALG